MSCRWWMKRDEGTNAVRVFVESEKDVEDQGLVTLITPGSTKGEINVSINNLTA